MDNKTDVIILKAKINGQVVGYKLQLNQGGHTKEEVERGIDKMAIGLKRTIKDTLILKD